MDSDIQYLIKLIERLKAYLNEGLDQLLVDLNELDKSFGKSKFKHQSKFVVAARKINVAAKRLNRLNGFVFNSMRALGKYYKMKNKKFDIVRDIIKQKEAEFLSQKEGDLK